MGKAKVFFNVADRMPPQELTEVEQLFVRFISDRFGRNEAEALDEYTTLRRDFGFRGPDSRALTVVHLRLLSLIFSQHLPSELVRTYQAQT